MKKFITILIIAIVIIGGLFIFKKSKIVNEKKTSNQNQSEVVNNSEYKNISYSIDGKQITLKDGVAETEVAPGSASKLITRYFGDELKTDLNGDGVDDVVFLLTQDEGGSGTFFYVVAALSTDHGYVGSDGYFLGDRIAPQNINLSPNPNQQGVIVVNYADRATNEPMSATPSIGKSVYLKLDLANRQWAIVEPNFTGESNR